LTRGSFVCEVLICLAVTVIVLVIAQLLFGAYFALTNAPCVVFLALSQARFTETDIELRFFSVKARCLCAFFARLLAVFVECVGFSITVIVETIKAHGFEFVGRGRKFELTVSPIFVREVIILAGLNAFCASGLFIFLLEDTGLFFSGDVAWCACAGEANPIFLAVACVALVVAFAVYGTR
tara:strand:+ start:1717 stop:2259 length:543 start_codon:yes stop_codon:yes gene_type:complete